MLEKTLALLALLSAAAGLFLWMLSIQRSVFEVELRTSHDSRTTAALCRWAQTRPGHPALDCHEPLGP